MRVHGSIATLPGLLVLVCGALPACDPARGGGFSGDVPDPVKMNGYVGGSSTGGTGGASHHGHSDRRWFSSAEHSTSVYAGSGGPPTSVFVSPWVDYYGFGDIEEGLEYRTSDSVTELLTVDGAPDYVYAVTDTGGFVQPVGPWGPTLLLSPGYHVFRRSCSADEPNQFTSVPLDTELNYDLAAATFEATGGDAFLLSCGITVPIQNDFGDKVATVPLATTYQAQPIVDIAWSPDSVSAYVVGGDPSNRVGGTGNTAVWALDTTQLKLSQVIAGDFYGPLQVATGGSSLLINKVTASEGYWGTGVKSFEYEIDRQPIAGNASLPIRVFAGNVRTLGSTAWWALSPDGQRLVSSDSAGAMVLTDLVSGITSAAPFPGAGPLAWDPTGTSLLVSTAPGSTTPAIVSMDGAITPLPPDRFAAKLGYSPGDSIQTLPFWSASGPHVAVQSSLGTQVYDYTTQALVELVEPTRVARPGASLQVVVAKDQVFAWAIQCWGIGETSCAAELRRLTIPTATIDVVARTNEAFRFAVSPDGTKIVFAKGVDLYLKTITP
jgi:hypothetical protein